MSSMSSVSNGTSSQTLQQQSTKQASHHHHHHGNGAGKSSGLSGLQQALSSRPSNSSTSTNRATATGPTGIANGGSPISGSSGSNASASGSLLNFRHPDLREFPVALCSAQDVRPWYRRASDSFQGR